MLKDDISTWSNHADELYKNVSTFIKDNPLPKVPEYDSITVRKNLYEAYAAVVTINNKVAHFLADVHNMLMVRAQLRRLMRAEGYGNNVVSTFNKYIEEVSDTINIIDKTLNVYKVGVEGQLRFYQSVQYILGSPRLNAYD